MPGIDMQSYRLIHQMKLNNDFNRVQHWLESNLLGTRCDFIPRVFRSIVAPQQQCCQVFGNAGITSSDLNLNLAVLLIFSKLVLDQVFHICWKFPRLCLHPNYVWVCIELVIFRSSIPKLAMPYHCNCIEC